MVELTEEEELLRKACEESLWTYARYVLPHFMFGDIHREMMESISNPSRKQNVCWLIPRDHLKSVIAGVYATWRIARKPEYTILYITADEPLGKLQMGFMQTIFESDRFRRLWPNHFDPDEGKREQWSTLAVKADHPRRKELAVRDETIAVRTVRAGKTGRHPDEILYDDIVVPENAYTRQGRADVSAAVSQCASLVKADGLTTGVGTKYHVADQYSFWKEAKVEIFNDDGEHLGEDDQWEIQERVVEDQGDGTGVFLWPRRKQEGTTDSYGWDKRTLAQKRSSYFSNGEHTQFYAQYYMKPHDPDSVRLTDDNFLRYKVARVTWDGYGWRYGELRMNIGVGMDTAHTNENSKNAKRADYTAIAVVGQIETGEYLVLALVKFQTDKRTVYAKELISLQRRWKFRSVRVEASGAGKVVVQGLKEYMVDEGHALVIRGAPAPTKVSKYERHASLLIPKYENGYVLHGEGAAFFDLEEQLKQPRPAHDDEMDAVLIAMEDVSRPAEEIQVMQMGAGIPQSAPSGRFGGRR